MHKIGIDLGGTKIEGILLDESLNSLQRTRVPTPPNDYSAILNEITSLVNDLSKNISEFTIGICTPGAISKKTGLLKNSNTQCLIGKPIQQDLEQKFGKSIAIITSLCIY